jgi:predicted GIY-YIG superfamily endonuclease
LASGRNGTPHVGVTSDLAQRATEHLAGALAGFTKKVRLQTPCLDGADRAHGRSDSVRKADQVRQPKGQLALIERDNPFGSDLYETLNA